jgi:hypothetical protein
MLGVHLAPGTEVDSTEQEEGIEAKIVVTRAFVIPDRYTSVAASFAK